MHKLYIGASLAAASPCNSSYSMAVSQITVSCQPRHLGWVGVLV